eukprot:CAMPEP_0205828328 /NCGR_PEP_ID=MMETSP0206-20130828/34863_1 /ASSEMBLY_ACC=CAM_ASM_000279 /TAXON_ID=36767 /ORGANISM="Euplotes focardii, Strain TN1" /LENGTH=160 /DNA_ID=CAMNT_0053130083 /DNA_START=262 /DNA_END=742 /DNA_ORIENTATION=-
MERRVLGNENYWNPEVWMVIRQAVESSPEDAAAILKAADVSTYTGSMVLCMDRDKVPYRVPVCVINEPIRYRPTKEEELASQERPPEIEFKAVKIRGIGESDREYDLSSYMTVQELLDQYMEDMGLEENKGLLIYDGRVMRNDFSLYAFRLDDEMVIQVM